MSDLEEQAIVQSWQRNASAWTRAVREQEIVSRREVTDRAILDAVLATSPANALDIGCGEGWLSRALAERGIQTVGVDMVASLVEAARAASPSQQYHCLTYEALARGALAGCFDVAICNFSLLGRESVDELLLGSGNFLAAGGRLIIQTLHPNTASGDCRDGWREGSWQGFSGDFVEPAPWYFRSLESWQALFVRAGLRLEQSLEPRWPHSGQAASIIFIARRI